MRAIAPVPAPDPLAPLRERLRLPAAASDAEVIAAAAGALASSPAPAPRATPAPVSPPLVAASGPSEAELLEEAEWEATTARLFGLPLGPASAALAERGLPTPAERRSDAYAAAQRAQDETFTRAAEADRLAQVRDVDAARGAGARVSAEDRAARERAQDLLLWPELGR